MKTLMNKLIPKFYGLYLNVASSFYPEKTAKKAFILFCTPRKGRVLPDQKSFLTNAKDDLIETDKVTVQTYRWRNEGPTVLLMHGWESNTFRWRNLIPKLQEEGFNVIAFDAPGHGYTSGRVLNVPLYGECAQKVIKAYRPKYIIGHSIGGMTMIYNQFKYSNTEVEKMISLGAPSELSDFMRQYKNILGLSKRLMKNLESYFIETFNFRFADFSSPKFAEHLSVKGLLIHDEHDAVASLSSSEQVRDSWKGSILIKTKGLGHSLHQDKVHNQIVEFLKS